MKKTIIIEGAIGIGKSHFARELVEILGPGTLYSDEPTDENLENPYLEQYYLDPIRWAYTMQTHLLQKRYRAHLESQWHVLNNKGHAVMDRSYFGDVVFAHVQKEEGYMNSNEFESYLDLYQCMTSNVLYPNVCILLDAPEEILINRIKTRNRSCECSIPIDYLVKLRRNLGDMITSLKNSGTMIILLDWSEDNPTKELRKANIQACAKTIRNFENLREHCESIPRRI